MKETTNSRAIIVCTGYDEASHFKDPGLIAAELRRLGYDVTCVVTQKGLAGIPYAAWRVELIPGNLGGTASWDGYRADVFIIYFIDSSQLEWVKTIRKNNPDASIILKCDSDGLLPGGRATVRSRAAKYQHDLAWFRQIASPHVVLQRPIWRAPLRVAGHLAWLAARVRPSDTRRMHDIQTYLESFDRIVIESTEAAQNLLLNFPSVAKKTVVVPNGVLQRRLSLNDRNNKRVIAVGRFNDYGAKRPLLMCRVLCSFLTNHPDWSADIIGPYDARLERAVSRLRPYLQTRLRLHGPLTNDETRAFMADSTICFSASAYESFGIAMAEALCEGCSVVSTPLPSSWDLSAGGRSGTVAATFAEDDLLRTLSADAEKWARNEYDRVQIATYWRPRLDWTNLTALVLGTSEDALPRSTKLQQN